MKKTKTKEILQSIFLGKRYFELKTINDQVRYMTMNSIFTAAIIPLTILGITMIGVDWFRVFIDFFIAFLCLTSLILIRSKVPLRLVPVFPVSVFGAYCLFLLTTGHLDLWAAVWIFSFPAIVIFLCLIKIGIIETVLMFAGIIFILYSPLFSIQVENDVKIRIILAYVLVSSLAIIYEYISIKKDKKEIALNMELAQERDVVQTMKDNIQQGIFLMDKELRILPQYSKPLKTILSYYDSELAGKNFLDILSASLDARQLNTMKGYFSMIFSKAKSEKVLATANPIAEFTYKVDDRIKYLSTKFHLIEDKDAEPVIIAIVLDISREKEFEQEMLEQKEAQELEMKNLFDVIQIDPLVFQDFIDDTESNFNYINSILKDRTLTEKQVVAKFFQNVHAMKSNALILGLETFGNKLHTLEDEIKNISSQTKVSVEDVLGLAFKLENIMQDKDAYTKIVKKIEAFKTSHQVDTILIHSLTRAVEKIAEETNKKAEIKAGFVEKSILETNLRKPIKDILFQCVRNSLYHGIESVDERIAKNKKPVGLLALSIKNVNGTAEIIFSDDGRGFEWEKIKAKFLSLNPTVKEVDRKVLLSAVFSPEFSTSDAASTIAGRGVGLSLVRDLVKENKGTIKVDSSGSGLTFKFTFPLTTGFKY